MLSNNKSVCQCQTKLVCKFLVSISILTALLKKKPRSTLDFSSSATTMLCRKGPRFYEIDRQSLRGYKIAKMASRVDTNVSGDSVYLPSLSPKAISPPTNLPSLSPILQFPPPMSSALKRIPLQVRYMIMDELAARLEDSTTIRIEDAPGTKDAIIALSKTCKLMEAETWKW